MTEWQFNLLRKIHFMDDENDEQREEDLKQILFRQVKIMIEYSEVFTEKKLFCVSDKDLQVFLNLVYDVLSLNSKNSFPKILKTTRNYILDLLSEANDKNTLVNKKVLLSNLYRIQLYSSKTIKAENISYVQDKLYKDFDIAETFKDKVERKVKMKIFQ